MCDFVVLLFFLCQPSVFSATFFMSFVYLFFFFWLRATLLLAVQRITLLFLPFFFVHRCTCICFLGQLSFFFGIFSQLSKIACIKSSTKLSSSFFLNFCSFWSPIWSFSEKKSGRFTNFGSGNTFNYLFILVSFFLV